MLAIDVVCMCGCDLVWLGLFYFLCCCMIDLRKNASRYAGFARLACLCVLFEYDLFVGVSSPVCLIFDLSLCVVLYCLSFWMCFRSFFVCDAVVDCSCVFMFNCLFLFCGFFSAALLLNGFFSMGFVRSFCEAFMG